MKSSRGQYCNDQAVICQATRKLRQRCTYTLRAAGYTLSDASMLGKQVFGVMSWEQAHDVQPSMSGVR